MKGQPATFYNPVQNNMGENLHVFIEQLYSQNKDKLIGIGESLNKKNSSKSFHSTKKGAVSIEKIS